MRYTAKRTPSMPLIKPITALVLSCSLALPGCGKSDATLEEPPASLGEYLVPPGEPILGVEQAVLGDAWWRWYFGYAPGADDLDSPEVSCHAQGVERGPFIDPNLPVDFLAGSGGRGAVRRVCSLEAGRHLFFPILTTMSYPENPTEAQCAEAQATEAALNDVVPFMEVLLNGAPVADMALRRVHSNGCTPLTPWHGMVLDGWWVGLKPLPPGTHTVQFKAYYDNDEHPLGHLSQDVKYTITIR